MGLGKTYSTKYLLDSNNSSGVAGQVLSTTSTGIDWVDANTVPGTGLWLANGNDIYNSNSGNVGIGTTLPGAKLDVRGSAGGYLKFDTNGSNSKIKSDYNLQLYADDTGDNSSGFQNMQFFTAGANERMRIDFAGRVGIGVTPKSWTIFTPIQIGQASSFVGRISSNQTDVATNWYYDGAEKRIASGYAQRYTQTAGGEHQWFTAGTDDADSTITFSQKLTIKNNGNVGIGATGPAKKLTVATDTVNDGVYITTSGGTNVARIGTSSTATSGALALLAGGSTKVFISAKANENSYFNGGGNVGIGTTTPDLGAVAGTRVLTIASPTAERWGILELAGNRTWGGNQVGELKFISTDATNNGTLVSLTAINDPTATGTGGSLKFSTRPNGGSLTERMRIDSAGMVGIGIIPGNGFGLARLSLGTGAVANEIIAFASASGGNAELRNTSSTGTFTFTNSDGLSEKMRINATGNVGIGTTSPTQSKLVISSGATGTVGGGDAGITMINKFDNPDNSWSILPVITGLSNTGFSIRDNTDSANRLVIDGSGNVGIGTDSPNNNLVVEKNQNALTGITARNTNAGTASRADINCASESSDIRIMATSSGYTGVAGWADSGILGTDSGASGGMIFNVQASAPYRWMHSATNERMRITPAGNVGIGVTGPSVQLEVSKSATIGAGSVTTSTTNHENVLKVKGKNNYSDGTTWYGDYGQILLSADSNMTGSAHQFLITNALGNNKFAIVRSVDANTVPVVSSTANGVNSGTADFVIDGAGNVGIGTESPDKTLTVGGTNTTHGIDIKTKIGTTVYKLWEAEQFFANEGYQGMYLDNVKKIQFRADGDSYFAGGDVGIGTTSPDYKLDVAGSVGIDDYIYHNGDADTYFGFNTINNFRVQSGGNLSISANTGEVSLYNAGVAKFQTTTTGVAATDGNKGAPGYSFISDLNTGMFSDTADVLQFTVGGDTNLKISSGYLDINQYIRHVGDADTYFGFTAANQFQVIAGGNTNLNVQGNGVDLSYAGSTRLTTQTGGIAITGELITTGDVGIGVTNPSYTLEVDGTMFSSGNFGNRNDSQTIGIQFEPGSTSSTTMAVYSDELKVYFKGPNTTRFEFEEDGTAKKPGGGSWSSTSDERVKKDITSYTKGLTEILTIDPVNYKYNGKAGLPQEKQQVGVIAQDIQEVFPDAVETYKALFNEDDKEETELLLFNPSELTFTLINAVKELKAEIELLKQQINN